MPLLAPVINTVLSCINDCLAIVGLNPTKYGRSIASRQFAARTSEVALTLTADFV